MDSHWRARRVHVVEAGKRLAEMGLTTGPSGNLSVRLRSDDDLDLIVDEISEGERVVVSGSGKDRMGNRLKLSKLSLELKPGTSGTDIAYVMDFNLYGRLASLGNSVIKRKAEEMRQEFTRRILAELETGAL